MFSIAEVFDNHLTQNHLLIHRRVDRELMYLSTVEFFSVCCLSVRKISADKYIHMNSCYKFIKTVC